MDTVVQRLWLTVPERHIYIDCDAIAETYGLDRACKEPRAIVLEGRYFRVERAKAALLEGFGRC